MSDTLNFTVGSFQAVPIELPSQGGSMLVTVSSGDTVFYSDHQVVSSTVNQGSIASGGSQTFTSNAWLISASRSAVKVVTTSPAAVDVVLGSDGFLGGPGGTQLTSSVASAIWGDADYLIVPVAGGGAQAINRATGLIDFTNSSTTDHSAVFQSAINALAVHNGGKGGKIAFKGQFIFNAQVILYPGIALVGQGPLGNKGIQNTGASIQSTYNGTTLLVTATGSSDQYFPALSGFMMYGKGTTAGYTSQNLIGFDNSGGAFTFDTFIDHVLLFDAGQHGIYIDATFGGKIWIDNCYLEGCVGDGINANAGTLAVSNCYIFGQTGNGINNAGASSFYVFQNRFWSNTGMGIKCTANVTDLIVTSNSFQNNGVAGGYACRFYGCSQTFGEVTIVGNNFLDTRAGSAVLRLLGLGGNTAMIGRVVGNHLIGATGAGVFVSAASGNKLIIENNSGFNDTTGKVTNAFDATGRMGIEGSSANPTASTTYKSCTPLMLSVSGGTGVSLTINDPAGNAFASGLSSYAGPLPVGYSVNFGAFSAAPTTFVAVA